MTSFFQRLRELVFAVFKGESVIDKSKDLTSRVSDQYAKLARAEPESALQLFQSSMEGLNPDQVAEFSSKYGPNEIVRESRMVWPLELLGALKNPFNILLGSIAIVSYLTGDIAGTVIVSLMILISVFLTFSQEYRSNRAAEKLKAMVTMTATVVRRREASEDDDVKDAPLKSSAAELPIAKIVPGDIIKLSAGDMLPADVRLLQSKDIFISQSALTGEAMPVEKHATIGTQIFKSLLEIPNICFMGTSVISGTATALVVRTGASTYFGSITKSIVGRRVPTSFDNGIRKFSWLMLSFMAVMAPAVFFINGFYKGDWPDAFMFALAVAVGLTPEMLPMIVTVNLAAGARVMSKKHVIVKRLNSIQNFGAMDVLCTDKTGTLTQDRVILLKCVDPKGVDDDLSILQFAYLNSFYQTGLKNLLDHAVLNYMREDSSRKPSSGYKKFDEIPFDFSRRRMSVVVEEDGGGHILICKGALDEVLNVSTAAKIQNKIVPLDETLRAGMRALAADFSEDGLRVLALAYREMPKDRTDYSIRDESDLVILGFLAFLDPPKETAARAIAALNKHGVLVKVLTGDSELVTRKICKDVGLHSETIVLGHEIELLSDEELGDLTEKQFIFARLSPAQKQRIIRAMHSKGHVVGFMGDGINDAPALKEADVGISVDNAVDIAKESADIILLEKSLLVLEEGVLEGRRVFGNIVKYLKMGASSNFGNVFSVLGASVFLPFLPMLPVQMLVQNLLYDMSQTAIPFDKVDDEYLEKPRKWEIADIGRYMFVIGPISSLFDYALFAVMWFVFAANNPAQQGLFQAGWFVEGLLSQTLIVHLLRTNKIPFLQSAPSLALAVTTFTVMAIGAYLPYSPLGPRLGFSPMPYSYFLWLGAILICYVILTQIVKSWLIRSLENRASAKRASAHLGHVGT